MKLRKNSRRNIWIFIVSFLLGTLIPSSAPLSEGIIAVCVRSSYDYTPVNNGRHPLQDALDSSEPLPCLNSFEVIALTTEKEDYR